MKSKKIAGIVFLFLTLLGCFYVAEQLYRFMNPEKEVLLRIDQQSVQGSIYQDDKIIDFQSNIDHVYQGTIQNDKLQFKVANDNLLEDVRLNNQSVNAFQIIKVGEVAPLGHYGNYFIVKITANHGFREIIFEIVVTLLLFGLIFIAIRPLLKEKTEMRFVFIYSDSVFKYIKKRDIIFALSTFLLTLFVVVGSDAVSFYNMLLIHNQGIDVYQFQVNDQKYTQFPFYSFPYHPFMAMFWGAVYKLGTIFVGHLPAINGYPYFQVSLFKLCNILFLIILVLSLFSYLIEQKILKNNVRLLFYICFLNPISFYIAVIYIHLDTLPLYLITLGVLLLTKGEKFIVLSAIFIGLGISAKSQVLILLPFILLVVFLTSSRLFRNKMRSLFNIFKFMATFGFIYFVFAFIPGKSGMPLNTLLRSFGQLDRLWYTVIQYAPGIMVFVTAGSVLLVTMLYFFNLNKENMNNDFTLSYFYISASLILVLSSTMLHTPATLLHTTVAFMLLYATGDFLQRFFVFVLSVLVTTDYFLTDAGDIGRVLGWSHSIMPLLNKMGDPTRTTSLIFTVSVIAMLAFSILFYRKSIESMRMKSTP